MWSTIPRITHMKRIVKETKEGTKKKQQITQLKAAASIKPIVLGKLTCGISIEM